MIMKKFQKNICCKFQKLWFLYRIKWWGMEVGHWHNRCCAGITVRKSWYYCIQYMWYMFMADTSDVSIFAGSYDCERNKTSQDILMKPLSLEAVTETSEKFDKDDICWDLLLYKYSKLDAHLWYRMGWKSKVNSENAQVGDL